MTSLVVTGATGFIGSHIVDAALDRNFEVVALVRNPSAMPNRTREGLHIKRWQLGEPLPELGGAKTMIHLAAYIPYDFSDPKQAASCFEINTVGAMETAQEAADQGVERFIHFSSGQTYATDEKLASEQTRSYPVNRATYYLASKLAGELCVQYVAQRKHLDVVVFRLASIYGTGMDSRGMLPNFVHRLSAREVVHLVEGGTYHVDFAYIDDVVDITFKAVSSDVTGIFNVGSGVASSSLDAASIIADILGADRNLIEVDGEIRESGFAALDVSRARETFGFQPRNLSEGVAAWLNHTREIRRSK